MNRNKSKIEKVEKITFIGFILTFLFFSSIKFMVGLFILLGGVICVKIYIYTLYKKQDKINDFWKKLSKPALVGLVTVFLLTVLEYYGVFQILI
jgi:hypothetical protein